MNKVRILIGDENKFIRQEVKAALANQPNLQVVAEAGCATELLTRLTDTKPQIAILDIALPALGGIDTLRKMREMLPELKIVVLTTNDGEELIGAAMKAGARGYVLKFDCKYKLVAAVRAACCGLRFFDGRVSEIVLKCYLKGSAGRIEVPATTPHLTPRELEVVRLLVRGCSNRQVAKNLGISVRTAETHRKSVMRKLNLHTIAELIHFAIANRILQIDCPQISADSSPYAKPFFVEDHLEVANFK